MRPFIRYDEAQIPGGPEDPAVITIYDFRNEHIVGSLWLHQGAGGTIYISWYIDEEHQGRGYATEAARQLIPHLFKPYRRIVAMIAPSNIASSKVASKLGFRCEGTAKQAFWNLKNQCWEDREFWALLEEDWTRQQSWIGKSH